MTSRNMRSAVGGRIRQLRKSQGKTLETLAKEVGVATSSLCLWERGSTYPAMRNFPSLCDALGISPSEFWAPLDEPEPEAA